MTFVDEMDKKRGSKPIIKVELILDSVTYDISQYYLSGGNFYFKKEREKDKISASDVTYTLNNFDNYFSEFNSSSVFFGKTYINKAKIKFYMGFRFNGTVEYQLQSSLLVVEIRLNQKNSRCYLRCQDPMLKIINEKVNAYPSGMSPVANAANGGDGIMSRIEAKPFSTISENVTVTFTSSTSFNVVGSVSGSLGTGQVDVEFISSGNKCKFTISVGSVAFSTGDQFTFSLFEFPQWDEENLGKIIWSIFTGYDWDTDTQLDWYDRSLQYDHTKSSSNTDLEYDSFLETINEATFFYLSGAVPFDKPANRLIEELVSYFLGAVWINPAGKIEIALYKPFIGGILRLFADKKKNETFNYTKSLTELVNSGVARFKATKSWAWSDDMESEENDLLDGYYAVKNNESINAYGIEKRRVITSFWYSEEGEHVRWSLMRMVDKYANAPLEVTFKTGLDAIQTKLGDRIRVSDGKSYFDEWIFEVVEMKQNFSGSEKWIEITAANDNTTGINWVFLGSDAVEADHDWTIPSSQNWDTATTWERQFCYLSTTGASSDPRYYLF